MRSQLSFHLLTSLPLILPFFLCLSFPNLAFVLLLICYNSSIFPLVSLLTHYSHPFLFLQASLPSPLQQWTMWFIVELATLLSTPISIEKEQMNCLKYLHMYCEVTLLIINNLSKCLRIKKCFFINKCQKTHCKSK